MEEHYIDFAGVKRFDDFYKVLIRGLDFPEWCGKNTDAIWDLVTGGMNAPATLYIKGVEQLPEDLKSEWKDVLRIFNEAKEWYAEFNKDFVLIFEDER